MLALTLPSVEVLIVCVVECSRCVMVCAMAAKKKPASAAQFRMKEEADKKKMARTDKSGNSGFGAGKKEGVLYPLPAPNPKNRTDARGRSGMGASKPKKHKDFYSSPAGKLVIATNPLLATGALLSAAETAVRKKVKGKKYAGDPGLKPGE